MRFSKRAPRRRDPSRPRCPEAHRGSRAEPARVRTSPLGRGRGRVASCRAFFRSAVPGDLWNTDAPMLRAALVLTFLALATPAFATWSVVDVTDANITPTENANPVKTLRMRYDAMKKR
jgi:hypothetical protein